MLEACWVQAQKCHNEAHDCVCAHVCAHVCPGICTCVYMRAGQQLYWLSLSITLCHIISLLSEAGLSLNLERTIFATLWALETRLFSAPSTGFAEVCTSVPGFYTGSGAPDSSHTFTSSTLPTSPSHYWNILTSRISNMELDYKPGKVWCYSPSTWEEETGEARL